MSINAATKYRLLGLKRSKIKVCFSWKDNQLTRFSELRHLHQHQTNVYVQMTIVFSSKLSPILINIWRERFYLFRLTLSFIFQFQIPKLNLFIASTGQEWLLNKSTYRTILCISFPTLSGVIHIVQTDWFSSCPWTVSTIEAESSDAIWSEPF